MFARVYLAAALALPILVAATSDGPSNQCNTGPVQCCNSVQSASDKSNNLSGILSLLGVVIGDAKAQVGMTCSPLTGAGIGGNSCSQQPVCCSNNSFNGVIAIGCTPINVSL